MFSYTIMAIMLWLHILCSIVVMLWFNFTLGLVFIFFCLTLIITHKHTQKQSKFKFKPRIKSLSILVPLHDTGFFCPFVYIVTGLLKLRTYLRKSFDALKCLLMHQPMIVTNQRGEHACNVTQNCGLRKFHISTILAYAKRILKVLRDLICKKKKFTVYSLTFKRLPLTNIILLFIFFGLICMT